MALIRVTACRMLGESDVRPLAMPENDGAVVDEKKIRSVARVNKRREPEWLVLMLMMAVGSAVTSATVFVDAAC